MSNVTLHAKSKSWRQCELVNNVRAIESYTFGIKSEVKSTWSDKWINKYTDSETDGFKGTGRP